MANFFNSLGDRAKAVVIFLTIVIVVMILVASGFAAKQIIAALLTRSATVSPVITIFVVVAVVLFMIIMFFGARRHWEVKGNGAMHAVTIVAVISFVFVLLGGLYWVATEWIFGAEAPLVRQHLHDKLSSMLDPRPPVQIQNNGTITENKPGFDWDALADWALEPTTLLYGIGIVALLLIFWPSKRKD